MYFQTTVKKMKKKKKNPCYNEKFPLTLELLISSLLNWQAQNQAKNNKSKLNESKCSEEI